MASCNEDMNVPLRAVVEGSPEGILAFDREFRYTVWNRAMEGIAGVPAEAVLGRVAWEVFPFLKEEGEDAFFAAALAGEVRATADRAFRVPESGRSGFFRAEYAPLRDDAGEVIGGMAVIRETTESKSAQEALRMHTRILESMSEGVSVSNEDGSIVYTNPAEERMFGYAPGELLGRHVLVQSASSPEENRRIVAEVADQLRTAGEWIGEWSNVRKDGTRFVTRARITALELAGRPHWVCVREDVTEERRAALANAQLLERIEFLAAASAALSSSLEFETTLSTVSHLAVPSLADWCYVQALKPDGSIELLTVGHADPEKEALGREMFRRYPVDLSADYGIPRVIRTGEPELVPELPPDRLHGLAQDEAHLEILRGLGPRSLLTVPLSVHGRVIGTLSLVQAESGRRFSAEDLPLVQELALRAAIAVENARLYQTAKESGAVLDTLFRTVPVALGFIDRDLRYRRVNDALARVDRSSAEEMIGRTVRDVIPELAPTLEPLYGRVIQGEEIRDLEVSGPRPGSPLETAHWLTNYTPVRAPDGEVLGVGVAALDITERKRAEEAQRFLADASSVLAGSLDVNETLRELTRHVVERFTDSFAVDLASEEGVLERVAVMSRDPHRAKIVQELERRYPTPLDSPAGHTTAFRTGAAQLYHEFTDELLRSASVDEEHFRLWKSLEMQAVINVPLMTRGRTLGVLSFVSHAGSRPFDETDVTVAVELARRAAIAIDNARLYTESQEANRAKAQFLATMSHELRTPLNAIGGYVDLLAMGIRGPVTDTQLSDLERIRWSQRHLLGLINEVLNYARLESGEATYDIRPVLVADALAAAAPLVEPHRATRGISLHVRVTERAGRPPLPVLADQDKLQQILLNLLSNAVKFTPEGGRVTVELLEEPDERGMAVLRVADTGIGIPEDQLEAIFEPFVQIGRALNNPTEGTGLGLTISRDLARGMGGDLTAESTPGAGSVFTLTLPAAQPERH
jgi:PAS domain S-box-containing protein